MLNADVGEVLAVDIDVTSSCIVCVSETPTVNQVKPYIQGGIAMKKRVSLLLVWVMVFTLIGFAAPIGQARAAGKVKLSKTSVTLKVGASKKLTLKNAKGKVSWSSLKKSVATVNKKGVVKAKKAGTAVIVATNKGKSFMCTVTVKKKQPAPTDDPEEYDDPEETPEPTEEPEETPEVTPTPTPTVTPTPVATPEPTPVNDSLTYRKQLSDAIMSQGTYDDGTYMIRKEFTKGTRNGLAGVASDGDILIFIASEQSGSTIITTSFSLYINPTSTYLRNTSLLSHTFGTSTKMSKTVEASEIGSDCSIFNWKASVGTANALTEAMANIYL